MAAQRLQKILAQAGLTSRRKAEEWILAGRVRVNSSTVTELGAKADADKDRIEVDGRPIRRESSRVYLMLNKPDNCMSTTHDPEGRRTVMDLVKGVRQRLYPVGRLDYHSEGLLLLTNDGEFANHILSAGNRIAKTYMVKVNGALTAEQEESFRSGLPIEGRRTAPAELRLSRRGENPWYEVRLVEGRQNQIRLMFRHFGRLVEKLRRVRIGPLELGSLKPSQFRSLTVGEVARLGPRRPRNESDEPPRRRRR